MEAMKQTLSSESDQCVRRFIELSIDSPTDSIKSKPRPSKPADDAEVLRQRIMAFRCDD